MEYSSKEVKEVRDGFHRQSRKLLNSTRNDIKNIFIEFMNYINREPIISDYIKSLLLSPEALDKETIVESVIEECRKLYSGDLDIGETREEQIVFIYTWFDYILESYLTNPPNNNLGNYFMMRGMMYTDTADYDELYEAFKDNIFRVFVKRIDEYLVELQ